MFLICLVLGGASAAAAAKPGHGGKPGNGGKPNGGKPGNNGKPNGGKPGNGGDKKKGVLPKSEVQKRLVQKLEEKHLYARRTPPCKRDGSPRRWRCRWQAEGRPPGEAPFECEGTADVNTRKDRWRIDDCDRPLIPLGERSSSPPLFGYHEQWRARGDLALAARGGAQIARASLEWDNVESSRGQYMWYWYDQLYYRMLSAGVRPFWYLARPPCWAQRQNPCTVPGTPDWQYHDELAAFAAAAAVRYPLSAGIQVWNEPNYSRFWDGAPDPPAYGDMARQVADAVHATGVGVPVINAGLAPLSQDSSEGMAFDRFLREAYEAGGPQHTDAIGIHPYPLSGYGTDWVDELRSNVYRHVDVMNDFGESAKPIWITEIGVSNYAAPAGFTNPQQAEALLTTYDTLIRIAGVQAILIHRLQDDPEGDHPMEWGYGVVAADGNIKPGFCALAAVRGVPC